MRHLNQQFQIKYDFAESATEYSLKFDLGSTFDLDVAFHMHVPNIILIIETLGISTTNGYKFGTIISDVWINCRI